MGMHRTYELYFRKDQKVTFHPITCSPKELLRRASTLLKQERAEQVEVREAGLILFTLTE